MISKFSKISAAAAIIVVAAAGSAEAKDWLRALERNEKAAETNKYVPKGENPQWDFDLETVVNDMNWRTRTASMLRNMPRPGATVRAAQPNQVADREEPPRLQFRF